MALPNIYHLFNNEFLKIAAAPSILFAAHSGALEPKNREKSKSQVLLKPRPSLNAFWKGLDEIFQMKPLLTKSAVSESSLKACFYFAILQDAWFFVNICTIKPVNGRFRENVVLF